MAKLFQWSFSWRMGENASSKCPSDAFANYFGINIARLRDWEQGRSSPGSMERAFLKVIEKEPETVKRVLANV
jgi:putative transcriptional regulator